MTPNVLLWRNQCTKFIWILLEPFHIANSRSFYIWKSSCKSSDFISYCSFRKVSLRIYKVALQRFSKFSGNLYRSSHREFSIKKVVRKGFAKFTEKYLCQSLFFNKTACVCPCNCFYERKRKSSSCKVKSLQNLAKFSTLNACLARVIY